MVKIKTDEYTRLEQEVVTMRSNQEKARVHEDKLETSSTILDELIVGRKPSKNKGGLGVEEEQRSKANQTPNKNS